jgi:hypothetical protein
VTHQRTTRTCLTPGCGADITDRKGNTRYCIQCGQKRSQANNRRSAQHQGYRQWKSEGIWNAILRDSRPERGTDDYVGEVCAVLVHHSNRSHKTAVL